MKPSQFFRSPIAHVLPWLASVAWIMVSATCHSTEGNSPKKTLSASQTEAGPASRNLLAHWRFGEAAGDNAFDETGTYLGRLSPTGVARLT